jgi:general secretion pathway protein K
VRNERGLALILVLWSLMLLTAVAVSFGYAVRVETAVGSALSDQVRAEAVAASGVRRAILGVLTEDKEARWPVDGRVREIPWPDAVLRASVRSESAKIDLNHAPKELLMGLFTNLLPGGEAVAEALADAVITRREQVAAQAPAATTRRGLPTAPPATAPPATARPPTAAPAATATAAAGRLAFRSVDELAQLPGFTPDGIWRLRPYLTVHGGKAKVDAASADVEVLAAVPGVSRDAAVAFVRDRAARSDETQALDISPLGEGARYLDAASKAAVANVRALARLQGGAVAMVDSVLRIGRGGKRYEVLEWRQSLAGTGSIPLE